LSKQETEEERKQLREVDLQPCGREIAKSSFITVKMLPLASEEWVTLQALKVQESPQN